MNFRSLIAMIAVLALPLTAAVTINYNAPIFQSFQDSTGTVLDTSYTFAVGTFATLTPTDQNLSDWATDWQELGSVTFDTVLNTFSGAATLNDNSSPFTVDTPLYIWGYNSTDYTTGSEWVMLSNTTWETPSAAGTPPPFSMGADQVGTVALVGVLNDTGDVPYIQTAAVPEPSFYALLISLAVLGMAILRRRR